MDGSHPAETPVPNRHIVSLSWWRTALDAVLALGGGFEAEAYIPYDIKDQKVRFETLDGQSFDNPEGAIHHRTERLEGIGDVELLGHYHRASWRFTAGLSFPSGRVEDNPYELGDLGIQHRHIQFGTGTFDPIARVAWSALPEPWGFDVSAGLRAPLYENRKGYRGSVTLDFSAGPRWAISERVSASARYTAQYQTRATWDGEPDENSGYFLQGIGLSAPIVLAEGVVLRPNALLILDVDVRSGADNFEMNWMAGLWLDVAFVPKGAPSQE